MTEPAASHRQVSWDVPCDREIIAKMRCLTREALTSWGLPHLADDAVLSASELVSNAVLHGEPPMRLSLWIENDMLHLAVADHGSEQPRLISAADDATHGRGMAIVAMLADQWGVRPFPCTNGKTVWCAFRLASSPPRAASPPAGS